MRAGRSVFAHTIARSPSTSPTDVPYGICGRALSGVTSAGACPKTRRAETAADAPSAPFKNVLRVARLISIPLRAGRWLSDTIVGAERLHEQERAGGRARRVARRSCAAARQAGADADARSW